MKRRNVLLGLGASAAGSGIVFGTGAFTQVEAERSLTIGVEEDATALLALDAGGDIASVYNSSSGGTAGELVIDTDELGGAGFNDGATAQIGQIDGDSDGPPDFSGTTKDVPANPEKVAFVAKNNFDNVADRGDGDIDITLDLVDAGGGGAELLFVGTEYDSSDKIKETLVASTEGNNDGQEITFNSVKHEREIYFSILIETDSVTGTGDFNGNIIFTAEPSSSGS